MIQQRAVSLNGEKVVATELEAALAGELIIQAGKCRLAKIVAA